MAYAFGPKGSPENSDLDSTPACAVLQGMHNWMYDNAIGNQRTIILTDGAHVMYNALKMAIEDYISESKTAVSEYWESKLRFFPSDILRQANLAQRKFTILLNNYCTHI